MSDLPIQFVRNVGQWDEEVRFGAVRRGMKAALTDAGMTVALLAEEKDETRKWHAVRFTFDRGDSPTPPVGERKLRGVHNYLRGNDPTKWHKGVPLYEAVRYPEVVPGVSVLIQERDDHVAYDLEVEPGADLSEVVITCEGANGLAIEPDGSLAIETPAGTLRQTPPKAWYELEAGETKLAECRFRLASDLSYGFEVVDREFERRVIIDPTLEWSTFLGTSGGDIIYGIEVDGGLVTVVGFTDIEDPLTPFPTTAGAFQESYAGSGDAFVTRLDPAQSGASQLVWSTLLGGSSTDKAHAVSLAANGSVALCGETGSADFPTSIASAYPVNPGIGQLQAFVAYLDSAGANLVYSIYLGGNEWYSSANDVVIDGNGLITAVGWTGSSFFPVTANAYDSTHDYSFNYPEDAFVSRINPALTGVPSLIYSSYLGGNLTATETDEATSIALESGLIYIGGFTASGGFDVNGAMPAYDPSWNAGADGFVVALDIALAPTQQLRYGTFIGGLNADIIYDITVTNGAIFVGGTTWSNDYPLTGGGAGVESAAFDSVFGAPTEGFISKIIPTATVQLKYSTYVGGSDEEFLFALNRVTGRAVVACGYTGSTDFMLTADALDSSMAVGDEDAFFVRLNWAGSRVGPGQLDFSTYLGDSKQDIARALASDGTNHYLGGETLSSAFPTTTTAFDTTYSGGNTAHGDGFAALIKLMALPFP